MQPQKTTLSGREVAFNNGDARTTVSSVFRTTVSIEAFIFTAAFLTLNQEIALAVLPAVSMALALAALVYRFAEQLLMLTVALMPLGLFVAAAVGALRG